MSKLSKQKTAVDQTKIPTTTLERLGGKPRHVVYAGKKASSRAERKASSGAKARTARQV